MSDHVNTGTMNALIYAAQTGGRAAEREAMAAAIWQAIRDGSNIDDLPNILGLTCPDCGGEPGGYYEGERFIQNECDLCGRVGSE